MKKIMLSFLMAFIIHSGINFINYAPAQAYKVQLKEELGGKSVVEGDTGVEFMMDYFGLVYKFAASLIGIVCVLIMVVSGIQIAIGGANNSFVSQAKDRIMQSLFSLILLFSSYLILRTVNPAFFSGGG